MTQICISWGGRRQVYTWSMVENITIQLISEIQNLRELVQSVAVQPNEVSLKPRFL